MRGSASNRRWCAMRPYRRSGAGVHPAPAWTACSPSGPALLVGPAAVAAAPSAFHPSAFHLGGHLASPAASREAFPAASRLGGLAGPAGVRGPSCRAGSRPSPVRRRYSRGCFRLEIAAVASQLPMLRFTWSSRFPKVASRAPPCAWGCMAMSPRAAYCALGSAWRPDSPNGS